MDLPNTNVLSKKTLFQCYLRIKTCLNNNKKLTDGAAQTLPLLSPFSITQNVNDERGELPGIETGQLLASLRSKKVIKDSLDVIHNTVNYTQFISASNTFTQALI